MPRGWAAPGAACLGWLAAALAPAAQPAPPATAPATAESQPARDLPAETLALLDTVEDFAFNFDHPAFYAVARFVKLGGHAPGYREEPVVVDDWSAFVERPGSFRGRPVTIRGMVARNKDPWRELRHPELDLLGQLELTSPGQPLACTVVLTNSAQGIPINATIEVTGYFVMVRQYLGDRRTNERAALLVATGPTSIAYAAPARPPDEASRWAWLVGSLVAALLFAWLLLRRANRAHGPLDVHTLRARHSAPMSVADDFTAWAEHEPDSPDKTEPAQRE